MLTDYRTAPISDALRATLAFVEKMTRSPASLAKADANAVYAAGVGKEALEDAITIAFAFNFLVRVADSLGFEVAGGEKLEQSARALLATGYRFF